MGILQGLGGIVGGYMGRGAVKQGNQAYNEALAKLQKVYEDQVVLNPEDYVSDYTMADANALQYYNPELEAAIQQEDSELAGISLDPAYQEAQREALQRLGQRADEGLTVAEEAARNNIMNSMNTANRGNQEAVMQSMARRGMGGSGAELAAALAGGQNAYTNAAQEAQNLAVQRDNRALEAALQGGSLATNLRNQDYSEQASLAKAQDAIAQFNANQRASVQNRNVSSKNLAQNNEANLRNKVYTGNLDMTNQQADQRNAGLQNSTNAQNQKAVDISNAALGIGKAKQAQGIEAGAFRAGMSEAIGKTADDTVKAIMTYGASEMGNEGGNFSDINAKHTNGKTGASGSSGGGAGSMFSGITKMFA